MSGTRIPGSPVGSNGVAKSDTAGKTDKSRVPGKRSKIDTESKQSSEQKPVKSAGEGGSSRGKALLNPATKKMETGRNTGTRQKATVPADAAPSNMPSTGRLQTNAQETVNTPEASGQVSAKELFNQTAAAMGFPKDALSTAILAFARLFSLSLNPALMGNLRREALASGKSSSPGKAKDKAALEAEALALLSSLDKGVELSPEALARYAAYFVPEAGTQGTGSEGTGSQGKQEPGQAPTAEELRAIARDQEKKDGFLDFLNSVPGKNGQQWKVFPFKIIIKGIELCVVIRTLKRGQAYSGEDEQVIADIAGPVRQWRFFLRKTTGKMKADIRVYPEYTPEALKVLTREARRFLGCSGKAGLFDGFDEILVQNGGEYSSLAEELCGECLPLIDKEV